MNTQQTIAVATLAFAAVSSVAAAALAFSSRKIAKRSNEALKAQIKAVDNKYEQRIAELKANA